MKISDQTGDLSYFIFSQFWIHRQGKHFISTLLRFWKAGWGQTKVLVGFLQVHRHWIVDQRADPAVFQSLSRFLREHFDF